jgi:1-acyl-sn-glycerol-3-phosphate acyltransferase
MFGLGQREVQDRFSMRALGRKYRFEPPHFGTLVPRILQQALPWYLNRKYGITQWEVRGVEKLRASVDAGHGVLIAPNHSKDSDSVAVGLISIPSGIYLHIMAGWHVLLESRFQAWVIKHSGGFSVSREGADRQAVRTAIDLVARASRPLVIFPEGYVTRTTDQLETLQEGIGLIARKAAIRRAKEVGGQVVIHPAIFKYQFKGDLSEAAHPMLADLEDHFGLAQNNAPLIKRLEYAREKYVATLEQKVLNVEQTGSLSDRIPQLIEALLTPLEQEWKRSSSMMNIYERVRRLRTVILEHSMECPSTVSEADHLRRHLEDCTLALHLACGNPAPLRNGPTAEHFMETLDALEEDTRGSIRTNRPWRLVIDIGEAIPIKPKTGSPIPQLREALESQLTSLAMELNQPLPEDLS